MKVWTFVVVSKGRESLRERGLGIATQSAGGDGWWEWIVKDICKFLLGIGWYRLIRGRFLWVSYDAVFADPS
jgi:hypothetical protein